jgi:uncharacterized protein DUF6498
VSTQLRVLLAVIVTGITVYGVFILGWSVATALALFWCENVVGIVLIALLFLIHRSVTHMRGHNRPVLAAFVFQASVFTLFHGIFLSFFIFVLFPDSEDPQIFNWPQFKLGMMMIGSALMLRFLIDAALVKRMPFAELRTKTAAFMSRVVVVHLTIIFGMMAMMALGRAKAMFGVFAALKLLADVVPVSDPKLTGKKLEAARAQMADDELVQA